MMEKTKWTKVFNVGFIVIALIYVATLIKLVFLKNGFSDEFRVISYIPLNFLDSYTPARLGILLKNVLGNFALFIPLGMLLPVLFKKLNFWKTLLIGFLTSLVFEVLQYALGCGISDIDDLILNTLGCAFGGGLYFLLFARAKSFLRSQVITFIVLAVFGCCGVLALYLYHPSALPTQVRYVNADVLDGAERNSYDITAVCTSVDSTSISLNQTTAQSSSGAVVSAQPAYTFSSNAVIISQTMSYDYSPNGNIQKTTVTYSESTVLELSDAIEADNDGASVDIWLNDNGEIERLVFIIYSVQS